MEIFTGIQMNEKIANELIINTLRELVNDELVLQLNTRLIGGQQNIDSMKIVELCLVLEDRAEELGFEFDWMSDSAMSEHNSIFNSVETLSTEFLRQFKAQK